jgi:sugar O-acyltransferase (sialic acid O-acetyltransferase NeuD family)
MANDGGLVIFGASGHGKVIIDCIERAGEFVILGVVDDDPAKAGQFLLGHAVLGGRKFLESLLMREPGLGVVVAVGDNRARISIADWIGTTGARLVSVAHPAAVVARSASVGAGTVIMPGAVINADAVVGDNAIVNTGACVDHDCTVGTATHIAPGAVVCGGVRLGRGVLVGAGARILPGTAIGDWAVVGAGAVVVGDIPAGAVAVGVPARLKRAQ